MSTRFKTVLFIVALILAGWLIPRHGEPQMSHAPCSHVCRPNYFVTTTVNPIRTASTVYQNTGSTPILVKVDMECPSLSGANFFSDSNPTPSTQIGVIFNATPTNNVVLSDSFLVQPGDYYEWVSKVPGGTLPTILYWVEYQ